MKRSITRLAYIAFAMMLGAAFPAAAPAALGVPTTIGYQGYLTTSAGAPVNTSVNLTIRVYDVLTGGAPLCTEVHNGVVVNKGVFAIQLNSTGACDALAFDRPYFLGVEVASGGEMSPRQPLTSSGYALATRAGGATANVNCGTGGSVQQAIDDAPAGPLTVLVTGTCNENVVIKRSRVTVQGANPNQADGIAGSGGGTAVSVIGATNVRLDNLTLGSANAADGVDVLNNGFADISNALIQGFTTKGVFGTRGGFARITATTIHAPDDSVAPVGSTAYGIELVDGAGARIDGTTIDGRFTPGSDYDRYVLGAYRSGPIRLTGANTLTNHHPDGSTLGIYNNVMFRQNGNTSYTGTIECGRNSTCQLRGAEIFAKSIWVARSSRLEIRKRSDRADGSTVIQGHPATGGGTRLDVWLGSFFEMNSRNGPGVAAFADCHINDRSSLRIGDGITAHSTSLLGSRSSISVGNGATLDATGNLFLWDFAQLELGANATLIAGGPIAMTGSSFGRAKDGSSVSGDFNLNGRANFDFQGSGTSYTGNMLFDPSDIVGFGRDATINGAIDCQGGAFSIVNTPGGTHTFPNCTIHVQEVDLAVTTQDNPDPVTAGDPVTHTYTVDNLSVFGNAQHTTLSVNLSGVAGTVTAVTPSQGSCNAGTLPAALPLAFTCPLGGLLGGTHATVTVDILPTTAGTLSGQVSVSAGETDPAPGNNSATETTTVLP